MTKSKSALEQKITNLVDDLTAKLVMEVKSTIMKDVNEFLRSPDERPIRPITSSGSKMRLCIAPGCTSPSKGPRYHYLCDKHKNAAPSDYLVWAKDARAKS